MITKPKGSATQSVPELDVAYPKYRRLLFGALARLARRGFVVPPDDGLDLIHDFFADSWKTIRADFDPEKNTKLETYVYQVFLHFARPRIMRMQRWRSCLMDIDDLTSVMDAEQSRSKSGEDLVLVKRALSRLLPIERKVLVSYLTSHTLSERSLASKLSMSRYRLREILIEAFGRMVALTGEPSRVSESDWKVAVALWQEGKTVNETAAHLGCTAAEVCKARLRIFTWVVSGLKNSEREANIDKGGNI